MSSVQASIRSGRLQGVREHVVAGEVLAFRGIPFAAPPLGALRFATPAPVAPWTGVRDAATSQAAPCQNTGALLGTRPVGAMAEDCLYLDVYTPGLEGRRPVMLWIYGGGFLSGSGGDVLTRGHRLAHHGDVVVVTFNYRLGAFGFLSAPAASLELHGDNGAATNAGLLDQIAVLRWIRDEIHHFGGDPGCVTIFGESSGGMSVCNLLTMPLARGLFHRAIAQSGFAANVQSANDANELRAQLYAALRLANDDIEALRHCEAPQILHAQQHVLTGLRRRRHGISFRPNIDPATLPEMPLTAISAARAEGVPLLIGTNLDEQRLFMTPRPELTDAALLEHVQTRLAPQHRDPNIAADAIALYRHTRRDQAYRTNAAIACAIETELSFRIPALRLAHARLSAGVGDVWMYLMSWQSPALRGWLGACHAIDVPFVFGNLDAPGMRRFAGQGAAAEALAHRMMSDWTHFARHGKPADPSWTPYTPTSRTTMNFAAEPALINAPYDTERTFWANALGEAL